MASRKKSKRRSTSTTAATLNSQRDIHSAKPLSVAVLSMDIVSYSTEFDETQARLVDTLSDIVAAVLRDIRPTRRLILPTGDGMIITLPGQGAQIALAIACAIHTEIKNRLLRMNLRMGIHEGQGLVIKDINCSDNIAGNVMNTCQRVMDLGDAQHILLSESAFQSLKNSTPHAAHISPVHPHPIRVKHDVYLNLYNYSDDHIGNAAVPRKVLVNIGIVSASIGRPTQWNAFVETKKRLRVIGHSLRLLASPDFHDAIEQLIRKQETQIQILMLNSLSAATALRSSAIAYKSETELSDTFEYVFKSLRDFPKRFRERRDRARTYFDVRVFDAIPTFAAFITDDNAYISMYLENALGSMGPHIVCNRLASELSLYASIDQAFESIWRNRAFSVFDRNLKAKQEQLIATRQRQSKTLAVPHFQFARAKK